VRVLVVSHAMVQDASRARWKRLAERHSAEVTLIVPMHWESIWFGVLRTWEPAPVEGGGFRVIPLPVTNSRKWGAYIFRSLDARLRTLRPDVIYVGQEETTLVLQQMILYRRLWARNAKLLFFSWNNLHVPQERLRARLRWRNVRRSADAAIAGNSEVAQVLRGAGFAKPLIVQTEIGVDEKEFRPDETARARVRAELGLKGFVIGFVGRLVVDKGVTELVEAALALPGQWLLMLVGDGRLRREVEARFTQHGLTNRLRLLGEQPIDAMPRYFQAMDVLVLPSRTMPNWKEQFGLVLAQAMACDVPVIGSSSGAIPEVIGEAGLVFPEGDISALRNCLQRLMADAIFRGELAQQGFERALAKYSATALADETHIFFQQLLSQSPRPQEAQSYCLRRG